LALSAAARPSAILLPLGAFVMVATRVHREPHQDRKNGLQVGCVDVHGNPFQAEAEEIIGQKSRRLGEREQQGQYHADQESSIDQTGQNEHFGLQFVHQFWLTS
jgi:hypothetical protein